MSDSSASSPGPSYEPFDVVIKRTHFITALRALEKEKRGRWTDEDPLKASLGSQCQAFRRACSLDLTIKPVSSYSSVSTPKTRLLTYTLTNAIFRHDWATAAQCLQLMVEIERCTPFVYRTILLVLFNHPQTTARIIEDFLFQVLHLKTRPDQLAFLRHTFHLPEDMGVYASEDTIISHKIEDEESDMSYSDNEE